MFTIAVISQACQACRWIVRKVRKTVKFCKEFAIVGVWMTCYIVDYKPKVLYIRHVNVLPSKPMLVYLFVLHRFHHRELLIEFSMWGFIYTSYLHFLVHFHINLASSFWAWKQPSVYGGSVVVAGIVIS